jgi:hypothetical protein
MGDVFFALKDGTAHQVAVQNPHRDGVDVPVDIQLLGLQPSLQL